MTFAARLGDTFGHGALSATAEMAMTHDSDGGFNPRSDRQLLVGVWALVCVAVLTTAALL
jgi:hypothetical protein